MTARTDTKIQKQIDTLMNRARKAIARHPDGIHGATRYVARARSLNHEIVQARIKMHRLHRSAEREATQ